MATYATVADVQARMSKTLSEKEQQLAGTLLEDAAVMIDALNGAAPGDAKKIVSCRMIARALGLDDASIPLGASQATVSALGYSQTFTMNGGSAGELYISKVEKNMLKVSNKIGAKSPLEDLVNDKR